MGGKEVFKLREHITLVDTGSTMHRLPWMYVDGGGGLGDRMSLCSESVKYNILYLFTVFLPRCLICERPSTRAGNSVSIAG